MDNVAVLLGQLFGAASLKKLCLAVSFIFVVLFWVGVYFFLHTPLEYFFLQPLLNDSEFILRISVFCLIGLILSGMAIMCFTKLLLGYFTEKKWFIAFNHAWDKSDQIRCINDGHYVHVQSIDNSPNFPPMIFYTICSSCKMEKRLIHDDGQSIPLANAQNIVQGKREKWKAYDLVVKDKKGNFYCKTCCSKLCNSDIKNNQCPYGCPNTGLKEEIEKIQKTSTTSGGCCFGSWLKKWCH